MIRLDKFLCDRQEGSRSQVKELIRKGRVCVNGLVEKKPESKIDENAQVTVDGRLIGGESLVYYMLNKPAGVVSATRDNFDKTVLDLLQDAPGKNLSPVGRLDKDTEGLLLITNDGELAHRLLSPKKHVEKTYYVKTKRPVNKESLEKLKAGVDIGEEKLTLPAKAEYVPEEGESAIYLTITEGKFHQVKRMLHAVDNEVIYLKRISMGELKLDETLEKGCYRPLTKEERKALGI